MIKLMSENILYMFLVLMLLVLCLFAVLRRADSGTESFVHVGGAIVTSRHPSNIRPFASNIRLAWLCDWVDIFSVCLSCPVSTAIVPFSYEIFGQPKITITRLRQSAPVHSCSHNGRTSWIHYWIVVLSTLVIHSSYLFSCCSPFSFLPVWLEFPSTQVEGCPIED